MSFILASTVLLTILYLKKWYWTKLNETTRKQVGHCEMSEKLYFYILISYRAVKHLRNYFHFAL